MIRFFIIHSKGYVQYPMWPSPIYCHHFSPHFFFFTNEQIEDKDIINSVVASICYVSSIYYVFSTILRIFYFPYFLVLPPVDF